MTDDDIDRALRQYGQALLPPDFGANLKTFDQMVAAIAAGTNRTPRGLLGVLAAAVSVWLAGRADLRQYDEDERPADTIRQLIAEIHDDTVIYGRYRRTTPRRD